MTLLISNSFLRYSLIIVMKPRFLSVVACFCVLEPSCKVDTQEGVSNDSLHQYEVRIPDLPAAFDGSQIPQGLRRRNQQAGHRPFNHTPIVNNQNEIIPEPVANPVEELPQNIPQLIADVNQVPRQRGPGRSIGRT